MSASFLFEPTKEKSDNNEPERARSSRSFLLHKKRPHKIAPERSEKVQMICASQKKALDTFPGDRVVVFRNIFASP